VTPSAPPKIAMRPKREVARQARRETLAKAQEDGLTQRGSPKSSVYITTRASARSFAASSWRELYSEENGGSPETTKPRNPPESLDCGASTSMRLNGVEPQSRELSRNLERFPCPSRSPHSPACPPASGGIWGEQFSLY
jgi:hypothetical protein